MTISARSASPAGVDCKTGSMLCRGADRFRHARRGVSQNQRTPRANVVDVLVFVGIPKMRSAGRER